MPFSDWLSRIAVESGWSDPDELRSVLVRNDCHCNEAQLRDWLTGETEPSYDKMRSVLSALQKELAAIDVWEHYKRFNEHGPQVEGKPAREETSLESVLRDNPGLPPGLSDD